MPLHGFQILGLEPVNGRFKYWKLSLKWINYEKLNQISLFASYELICHNEEKRVTIWLF